MNFDVFLGWKIKNAMSKSRIKLAIVIFEAEAQTIKKFKT